MLRYAHTAHTAAQNAGRVEAMEQQKEMGIKVQKQWIATLDRRTRDSHAYLDGQIVDVDQPFQSLLGEIMYPGDPNAEPGDVWNCRCTLGYVYPEYPAKAQRRDNETGEIRTKQETYEEWKARKKAQFPEKGSWIRNQLTEDEKASIMQRDYSAAYFSSGTLEEHFLKHQKEFDVGTTKETYLQMARTLLQEAITEETPAILRADEAVSRYDYKNNLFVVGNADGTIKTFFKPKDKTKYWRHEYERN